jgi:putative aldouronate transport system permease protein
MGLEPVFFLGDKHWFPYTLVLSEIWKSFGFGTIIYLAALTGIDPCLYEAAAIDGAGRIRRVWNITVPGILPIVVLMTVLSLGNVLNAGFEQVLNLYSPLVMETGDIIDTFIYRLGLQSAQFGPATAVGLFKSLISFAFVSVSYVLADKLAGYRVF